MKTIVVASTNPVKRNACASGFAQMFTGQYFDIQGISVPSGVADQPMSDEETLQGALNRARNARAAAPQAHFWAGIEGGICTVENQLYAFAWAVVLAEGRQGQARTAMFQLPPPVAHLVRQGYELGHADDLVFGAQNSKHSSGAVGLLTHGLIDRAALYVPAVCLALVPFARPELYPAGTF